ncbi:MAG: SMP-30/gluconolactonase/LRE family protein [Lentisphaerae bacterium]|nr:SMP-30/gluconolactonase/LRE family protein [Lentisphaerota bacterium]
MKMQRWVAVAAAICATAVAGAAEKTVIDVGERPESITRGWNGDYFLTVMGGEGNGDAVVKRLRNGRLETFAKGMDEPKGIAFVGGFLVASDLKRMWKIDEKGLATVLVEEKDFPHPVLFLNDVAASPDGKSVFVTDMGAKDLMFGPDGTMWPVDSEGAKKLRSPGYVYRVTLDGKVSVVVEPTPVMPCPNGVGASGDAGLLIAEFFHGRILELRRNSLRTLTDGLRGADGIERAKDGSIYVSSWTQGKVWKLDADGKNPKVILEGLQSAADFFLDEAGRRLLGPDMKAGTLTFLPLE